MERIDGGPFEPVCERSTTLWFDDGNLVLRTGTKQYRVHRSVLGAHSSVFRDMFSIPQPGVQDTIDRCSVVDVTDSAKDWDALLPVMYGLDDMFDQDSGVIPFDTLRATLVLGTKYNVERYRDLALSHLSKLLPQKLSEWDANANLRARYNRQECALLELVLSFGYRKMLPSAYYTCISQNHMEDILEEYRQDGDRPLSFDALHTLVQSQQRMLDVFSDAVLKWCWDGTIPSDDCSTNTYCSQRVADAFRRLATSLIHANGALEPFPRSTWRSLFNLCPQCEVVATQEHAKGRQLAWAELPKLFHLENWESLGE